MFSRRKKNEETPTRKVSTKLSQSEVKEILRIVPRDEAFYFYEEVGKPVGYIAISLVDFCDKVNTVRSSSLIFHLKRKDFESWISEIVGDSVLAKRISSIDRDAFDLKAKLYAVVGKRIRELKEMLSTPTPTPTVVSGDLVVTPRFPETEPSK